MRPLGVDLTGPEEVNHAVGDLDDDDGVRRAIALSLADHPQVMRSLLRTSCWKFADTFQVQLIILG